MKIPFSCRRMTAYQSVVASSVALIRYHGAGGSPSTGATPVSTSRPRVVT